MRLQKLFHKNALIILLGLSFILHAAWPHDHHYNEFAHHANEHSAFHCHSLNHLTTVKQSVKVKIQKENPDSFHYFLAKYLDFQVDFSTDYKYTFHFVQNLFHEKLLKQLPIRGSPLM